MIQYPVYAPAGETTGMKLSIPFRGGPELEIMDPAMHSFAEGLNGVLVHAEGEVYSKEGIEVPPRQIMRVTKIEAVPLRKKCTGPGFAGGFYQDGEQTKAFIQKGNKLLDIMTCTVDEDQLICRDLTVVDAGYELEHESVNRFAIYEITFFDRKKVGNFSCESVQ